MEFGINVRAGIKTTEIEAVTSKIGMESKEGKLPKTGAKERKTIFESLRNDTPFVKKKILFMYFFF